MRKSIVAAATALAVSAAGIVVAARPTTAAVGDVPADCSVFTTAYRSDGQRLTYVYDGGTTSTSEYANDNLGWVPTSYQQIGASGDDTVFRTTGYAARAGSDRLFKVTREGHLIDGSWRIMAMSASHIGVGFAGARILASASPYLYHVAGTSLYRSTESYVNGVLTLSTPVKLAGKGWDTVNTLVYERSGGTGTAAVDVLIGTKANGELKEWRINRATPTTISSKVLRSTGWGAFTTLSTGSCDAHPDGRALLGITATGRVSVHFDAKKTDGIGTDINCGSLGSLGWTAKAYGQ
ncbi:tachylectin-related carbohydrate-binding protein [Kribbella sp. NPDC050820]|uniref:tachylectin-related carbohydrate-binding protein n=1 Tax=Kribbella sp. NPDC050820 TaxID=3155408 RepID=UPI0033E2A991